MEREDGVWDIQKGQSLSWDNRSEADSEVDSDTSSGYIIDALMKRKEVEDKAFHARQWKLDPECVRDCVPNSVALFFLTIDLIDATIDAMLCKRPAGEHGRHCMCGCRKVFPEEVRRQRGQGTQAVGGQHRAHRCGLSWHR